MVVGSLETTDDAEMNGMIAGMIGIGCALITMIGTGVGPAGRGVAAVHRFGTGIAIGIATGSGSGIAMGIDDECECI